jgi:hypothetical protein
MITLRILLSVSVALFAVSCASPIERRVTKNPQMFNKLTSEQQQSVQQGRVKEGMSRDAVYLAWGHPSAVSNGSRDGRTYERWNYTELQPVYINTLGAGISRHACGFYDPYYYSGPIIDYVRVPGRSVEFVNNKVSGFLVPRH